MVTAFLAHHFAPSSRGLQRFGDKTKSRRATNRLQQQEGTTTTTSSSSKRLRQQTRIFPRQQGQLQQGLNDSNDDYRARNDPVNKHKNYGHDDTHIDDDELLYGDSIMKVDPDDDDRFPWRLRRRRRLQTTNGTAITTTGQKSSTAHKRKPFRAMAILTSIASDLDVIMDWIFLYDVIHRDKNYRNEYNESNNTTNNDGNSSPVADRPYLIPPYLIYITITSCIVGTIMWLILATDGRIIAPILRKLRIDTLNIGFILLCNVLLEDIPQVILTFVIEDYYEDNDISTIAICNVMASLYDTLIKLAEAIDERYDRVETGAWCKQSIQNAHANAITTILTITNASTIVPSLPTVTNDSNRINPNNNNQSWRQSKSTPLLVQPQLQPSMVHPTLQFLSASLDGTIKLWSNQYHHIYPYSRQSQLSILPSGVHASTHVNESAASTSINKSFHDSNTNIHDVKCIKTYNNNHTDTDKRCGVTCLALLPVDKEFVMDRFILPTTAPTKMPSSACDTITYFLSGHQNGIVQLWNIEQCASSIRQYNCQQVLRSSSSHVTGIAIVVTTKVFVAAYEDGIICIWHVWSGFCYAQFCGSVGQSPSNSICTICALNDNEQFVTGSNDCTLRLWNMNSLTKEQLLEEQLDTNQSLSTNDATSSLSHDQNHLLLCCSTAPSDEKQERNAIPQQLGDQDYSNQQQFVAYEIYQGHNDIILSVACMECGTMFVSGSMDSTARLWDIYTNDCIQVFKGHTAGVSTVTAVDDVTLLTGSMDTTLKLWDTLRGTCLRTYWGHTNIVTGVSVTDDDTTFVTSSNDQTINIWVLTALPHNNTEPDDPTPKIDDLIITSEGCCRGYEPE